jgi:hypothetical protein
MHMPDTFLLYYNHVPTSQLLADKEEEKEKEKEKESSSRQELCWDGSGFRDREQCSSQDKNSEYVQDARPLQSSSAEDSEHVESDSLTAVHRRRHMSRCKKAPIESPDPQQFGTWMSILVKTSRVGQVAKRGLEEIKRGMEALFVDGANDAFYFRILADALVAWIGETDECQAHINSAVEAGMLELIMKYLSRAKGDPVCQKWGLRAMRYLTFAGDDNSMQPTKDEEGIFHFVHKHLREYRNAWDVQHWGIRVCCNLTYKNKKIVRFIVENGVLDDVTEALDSHTTNCTVQKWCMIILCNISVYEEGPRAQIIEKHLSRILFALKKHEDNSAVQQWATTVLGNIMCCSKHQNDVLKSGAVPLILKGITNFGSNREMQQWGIVTICNLITGNAAASQRVGEEGGLRTILTAMITHINILEIQEWGVITLQRLAVDSTNKERFRPLSGTLTKLADVYQKSAGMPQDSYDQRRTAQKYRLLLNGVNEMSRFACLVQA